MLQTFLIVAVPALVTLTAAFFILRNISREEPELHGPRFRTQSGFSSGDDGVANRRPQTSPGFRSRRNTSVGAAGDASSAGRRVGSGTAQQPHTGDCVICFEESNIVELYPCKHRNLCESCVVKLISRNSRVCPLCRRSIQGYTNAF